MASSSGSKNSLQELTNCSICYSTLFQPQILPCGHTYCSECIQRLRLNSNSPTFECPECRQAHAVQQVLPTDFKLKQLVEMMHLMCNDQKSDGQTKNKICSNCASAGHIDDYFICDTCVEEDQPMRVYCAVCVLRKHRLHTTREALHETKATTNQAMDDNMALITQIMHDTDFFRNRYDIQNDQISFVFRLLLEFCDKMKRSIESDFKLEYTHVCSTLHGFLDKTRENINQVFNESDNRLYQLCMSILATFERSFGIPPEAMEQLKAKILKNESADLFAFFFNNAVMSKDDLPNPNQASTSALFNHDSVVVPTYSAPQANDTTPDYLRSALLIHGNGRAQSPPPTTSENSHGVKRSPAVGSYGIMKYRREKR